MFVPYIVENTDRGETRHDVFSRLLKDRIVFISGEIESNLTNMVVAQLLFLSNADPDAPIKVYINSPGGSIIDGMSIVDCFNLIPNRIETVAIGQASSMGAILLAAGDKRRALPNSRILIHQPLGGVRGQCADIQISAKNIQQWKDILNKFLADRTGQPFEVIERDTDRDKILTPEEALAYGLIDEIVVPTPKKKG